MKINFIRELVALRYGISGLRGTENEIDHLLDGLLRTVGDSSLISIYIVENGQIRFANPRLQKFSGYSEHELIGMNPLDLVNSEDISSIRENAEEILRQQRHHTYEYRFVRKGGEWDWVLETFTPIWYGENHRAFAYFMEPDEQRRAEDALREITAFSSKLLSNSPSPTVVTNPDTSIRYINPALEKLTGFSSSEINGRKAPYPWWLEEGIEVTSRIFRKAVVLQEEKWITKLFQKKNGEHFVVKTDTVSVESDGNLKCYVSSWVDITKEMEMADNMAFYITEITRTQEEERKRIARDIHDGTVQELSMVCGDCGEIIKNIELPSKTIQQVNQLRAKIKGVLDDMRQLSHELRPGLLDQFGLLPSLELLTEEINKDNDLGCHFEIVTSERRLSPLAELSLYRVTQEALRNVRKHAKATDAVVSIEFTDYKVKLCVTDNGAGFAVPEILSTFARQGKLGLMGMQERVRLLDGILVVESKVGKGTTVTVVIPE